MGRGGRGGGEKIKNVGPCTKLNQKCMVKSSGWPHQNVSIYLIILHGSMFLNLESLDREILQMKI